MLICCAQSAVPAVFVNKIKECFLDSLYYFLDGMVHLALSEEEPLFAEQPSPNHGIDWRDRVSRYAYLPLQRLIDLSRILELS